MVDITHYIGGHCRDKDTCVCVLDVEGSEFRILRRMVNQRAAFCLCNVLIVEWHEPTYSDDVKVLLEDFPQGIPHPVTVASREMFSAAVFDSALRFILSDPDDPCRVNYISFRYDEQQFDI
ncbi:hypothetical protein FOZ61_003331 [Perkinsus olseni]|uniref:Methyltransferase FkbM domain-containing protein n=1 Tax=Perkinsus olseni TaxID=32597 RepID=A0A7J6LQB4_PEROL|nr:hypothetical protein FOZ61_003331 [Perkinsus olseni]